ncbi:MULTISPECIES: metal ABC transporter substrate-binding protein [unclassified Paenibacillus]|uniref:metal ABC transporter substrate-binding protein n=1 Tax=unclassified Paenibacillus TaxID=185978 RepID=UPI000CFD42EF|nr:MULTISPECIES: metal ABC transporter substrate-binding protein [unclassified Paenibacillus]PRA07928.1 ABC transporter substrate-binding protein [Paenibacillus sp. MYb63]PRA47995.1 ABC transporter substrate-binding protein [Paenibacillus sp. MYb67]QZN74600.1 metal ABC transporter substrate-binding protein [Paenibacillus sp. DR312]
MKFSKKATLGLLFSLTLIVAGCGQKSASDANTASTGTSVPVETETAKLNVQVSFYPMYEFTKNVAGDLAEVQTLVPAGMEPHDWEPTPQDIASIEKADVLVYNGAGMESWMDQVTGSLSNASLIQVEASKGINLLEGGEHDHHHEDSEATEHDHDHADEATAEEHDHDHDAEAEERHDHDHGGLDPHVWLSPALAVKEVRNIEAGLAQASPEHAEQFKQNADAYIAQLESLDQDFKAAVTDSKRKDFITQHAAFGYLAKEYGLQQVPIAGLSPEQEPSAAQMASVIDFAKEHQVKTIFFETLVSSKVSETIAGEVGAKTAVLNPIEGLTEEEIASGMDYISVMRQNLEALKLALNE